MLALGRTSTPVPTLARVPGVTGLGGSGAVAGSWIVPVTVNWLAGSTPRASALTEKLVGSTMAPAQVLLPLKFSRAPGVCTTIVPPTTPVGVRYTTGVVTELAKVIV